VKLRLTPRETSFYDLFAEQADNLIAGAALLTELLGASGPAAADERAKIAERMRAAEHTADDSTHKIYNLLNSSFITPFDREDIYALASTLDDVMDEMEAAMRRHRPDVLGDVIAVHADGSYTDTVYFESEEAARAGETTEMPAEVGALFNDLMAAITVDEYLDLKDPSLS